MKRNLCFIFAGLLSSGIFAANATYDDAYTMVVGATPMLYPNLPDNLSSGQIKVSRIVFNAVSPVQQPADYGPNMNPTSSFQTLLQSFLPGNSLSGIEVYVDPDSERGFPGLWIKWLTNLSSPPSYPVCHFQANSTTPQGGQEMMAGLCWATAMNHALGGEVIQGLAYDNQSTEMPYSDTNVIWFKSQMQAYHKADPDVPEKLGFMGGGAWTTAMMPDGSPALDISFVEVYDLDKGNASKPRISSVALESVPTILSGEGVNCPSTPATGTYCSSIPGKTFPGLQWEEYVLQNPSNQKAGWTSAAGTSITGCALNPQDSNCDVYHQAILSGSAALSSSASLEDQILASYAYIFTQTTQPSNLAHVFGQVPANSSEQIVYLFSTQYIGPEMTTSPITSGCLIADADPTHKSSCGSENGFGVWNNEENLQNFKNLTHLFLQAVDVPNASYAYDGKAGIYLYDFIPSNWYAESQADARMDFYARHLHML